MRPLAMGLLGLRIATHYDEKGSFSGLEPLYGPSPLGRWRIRGCYSEDGR